MKKVLEALWEFFFFGNVYPITDCNSIPVYAGSILVSIAFAWNFYPRYALAFSVILLVCLLNTFFWVVRQEEAEDRKSAIAYSVAHDVCLGIAIVIACFVKFDLAIYTFGFIAILQFCIWAAEDALDSVNYSQTNKVIKFLLEILNHSLEIISSVILPIALPIVFIMLCLGLSLSNVTMIGIIASYFIVIPIASTYQDGCLDATLIDFICCRAHYFEEFDD